MLSEKEYDELVDLWVHLMKWKRIHKHKLPSDHKNKIIQAAELLYMVCNETNPTALSDNSKKLEEAQDGKN